MTPHSYVWLSKKLDTTHKMSHSFSEGSDGMHFNLQVTILKIEDPLP